MWLGIGAKVRLISIGSSIWFDPNTWTTRGIVEYHPSSDTIAPIIDYPEQINPGKPHSLQITWSQYRTYFIAIIDQVQCSAATFDTRTREYSNSFSLIDGPLDCASAFFLLGDYVHGYQSFYRGKDGLAICSLTEKTIQKFKDQQRITLQPPTFSGSVVKTSDCYQSSDPRLICGFARNQTGLHIPTVIQCLISEFATFEIYKFGGLCFFRDSFCIGTLKKGDPAEPIEWKAVPPFRLERARDLNWFGCIHYGSFIVIFGGGIQCNSQDVIYILDLHKNTGWIESTIKCPRKTCYHAVLDDKLNVHLFDLSPLSPTIHPLYNAHQCIKLADIIPSACFD